ncbi:MAG TPA: DUF1223 domain-containing protein [Dokdonella sp.]
MRLAALCLASIFAGNSLAHADCAASSTATRTHLVELYTSEGCSSCPPADHWLSALPDSAGLVPLAFHVDYWDSSAWTDRFADPRFTQRQSALAAHADSTLVYTPEVALDGREWRGWGSGKPPASNAASTVALSLHVDSAQPLRVRLDAKPLDGTDANAYVAYFALAENQLSSAVRGGENKGAELHHDHVVRALAGPLKLASAQATIDVPADLRREHAAVVAFVQRVGDGEIAAAVQLPLVACPANGSG